MNENLRLCGKSVRYVRQPKTGCYQCHSRNEEFGEHGKVLRGRSISKSLGFFPFMARSNVIVSSRERSFFYDHTVGVISLFLVEPEPVRTEDQHSTGLLERGQGAKWSYGVVHTA